MVGKKVAKGVSPSHSSRVTSCKQDYAFFAQFHDEDGDENEHDHDRDGKDNEY